MHAKKLAVYSRHVIFGIMGYFFTIYLSSCSSGPPLNVEQLPDTASPSAELGRLEENLRQSEINEVNVYAPKNFSKAQDEFMEAREKLAKGKSNEDVLKKISEGNAYLRRADESAQISQQAFGNVVEARRRAVEARAPQLVAEKFSNADNELKKAAESVENGDTSKARSEREDLEKKFKEVEVSAVLQNNLGPAAGMLKSARNEGARDWAPQAYTVAEKQFSEAKDFILKHPEEKDQVNNLSQNARSSAERALQFTREAKAIDQQSPEETVALLERERMELKSYEEKNAEIEAALVNQQSKIQSLESQTALNDRYSKARAVFKPSEADVLRQGDSLLIRLKGMTFARSRSDISPQDFALLNKVAKVIQEFGKPSVRVEGYTDSTGRHESNQKISMERAEAVKDYLAANQAVQSDRIEAIGKGDENPIASNKTRAGRELNRRVDVVIEPAAVS